MIHQFSLVGDLHAPRSKLSRRAKFGRVNEIKK
jgi:hypothetical protein